MLDVNKFISKNEVHNIDKDNSGVRIGQRIKTIREARGMTRAELGMLVGLDQNRIQQYENGRRKPKLPLLKKSRACSSMWSATLSYSTRVHLNAITAYSRARPNSSCTSVPRAPTRSRFRTTALPRARLSRTRTGNTPATRLRGRNS